jgi:hypothetical protein
MIKKVSLLLLVLFIFAFVGFSRDFLFKNTNTHLGAKLYEMEYSTHNFMDFLQNFSYWTIYTLKWIMTILFAALYYFIQRIVLIKTVKANFVKKWLNFMYLFLLILSALALGIGWVFGNLEKGYTFSRIFMGILQSPLPIMFLLPVAYANSKLSEENKTN